MSKQRVFSREYTANYADYNKLIHGTEVLKAVKQSDPEVVIHRFINYQQFQTLSNAYFAQEGEEKAIQAVTNLYDSNGSFLQCECDTPLPSPLPCNPPYLYPYGEVVTNRSVQSWFPAPLSMKKWCSPKSDLFLPKPCPPRFKEPCPPPPKEPCPPPCGCCYGKTKPLFI